MYRFDPLKHDLKFDMFLCIGMLHVLLPFSKFLLEKNVHLFTPNFVDLQMHRCESGYHNVLPM